MKKKLLCLVLAIAMILTVVPAQVFADYSTGWQSIAWAATLNYNLMDGNNGPSTEREAVVGFTTSFDVSSTKPTRSGYIFRGWSLFPLGLAMYQGGDDITISRLVPTVTLYAVWEKEATKNYAVSYQDENGNNSVLTVPNGTVISFESSIGTKNTITVYSATNIDLMAGNADYTQKGWSVQKNSITGDYVFTAVWESAVKVSVKYKDAESGVTTMAVKLGDVLCFCDEEGYEICRIPVSTKNNIDTTTLSKLDFANPQFKGWFIDRYSDTVYFIAQFDVVKVTYFDADLDEQNVLNVDYGTLINVDPEEYEFVNGEHIDSYSVIVKQDESIGKLKDTDTEVFKGWTFEYDEYEGYSFTPCFIDKPSVVVSYSAIGNVSATFAAISGKKLTIEANNGTYSSKTSVSYTMTSNMAILSDKYVAPSGYIFNGWEKAVDKEGNVVLTASLKPKTGYAIIYNDTQTTTKSAAAYYGQIVCLNTCGGQISGPEEFAISKTITTIENPVYKGHTFYGWKCTTESSIYGDEECIVFTAQWKGDTYLTRYPEYDSCDHSSNECFITAVEEVVDVNTNMWYHDGIHFCLQNNIMKTTTIGGKSVFNPNAYVTRKDVMMGLYALENDVHIDDVTYIKAAAWAVENEIFIGDGSVQDNGYIYLKPDRTITRQELATALYRYAEHLRCDAIEVNPNLAEYYDDASFIADYALEAIDYTSTSGLLVGIGNRLFNPRGYITRAQLATIFVRLYELY